MSERHVGKRNDNSARKKAPLRNIVQFLIIGDTDIFGSGSKALLECGHSVWTHSNNKARCIHCAKNLLATGKG